MGVAKKGSRVRRIAPVDFLTMARERGASDVHLVPGHPAMVRRDGALEPLFDDGAALAPEVVVDTVEDLLADHDDPVAALATLGTAGHFEWSIHRGEGRFRVSAFTTDGRTALSARVVAADVPSIDDIGLPEHLVERCSPGPGIVIVTGPAGAGKSTTLAALTAELLARRPLNVVTLEDPIEYRIPAGRGIISQRQLGRDFHAFEPELRHLLRLDPDVVLVGEMRDLETIARVVTLAETGHLVLTTLHTASAAQAVSRIVDVFPPHQQDQVRTQLALSLRCVVAQRLLPRRGGGRIALREILFRTPAVANIIRENRLAEFEHVLQTGEQHGMVSFARDEARLVEAGCIDPITAAPAS